MSKALTVLCCICRIYKLGVKVAYTIEFHQVRSQRRVNITGEDIITRDGIGILCQYLNKARPTSTSSEQMS